MLGFVRKSTLAAVGVALCAAPTVVIAAPPMPAGAPTVQPVASAQTVDPWLALSAMTTNSSSASTAAAAAQGEGYEGGFPPWPALAVIVATIGVAIYILLRDDDSDLELPVSPS